MGARSTAAAPTRYAGIQVQTSALGVQIPIIWGTGRCKCNLVDYLDFNATAQKAQTGKGGQTTTGYSYTATIIVAICEGPIFDITQVWVDGKNYAFNSNGSGVPNTGTVGAISQAGLALSGAGQGSYGTVGQAVWSYLTSNHPTHAIGYSGLVVAHAVNYPLDASAGTPQHNFEVVSNFTFGSLPDCDPEVMLTDFFTNTRYGLPNWGGSGLLDSTSWTAYSTMCRAYGLLLSPVLDQERQASDFLTEVMTATNSDPLWSEGVLKIVTYSDTAVTGNGVTFTPNLTPVYAFTEDNFVPQSDSDDPLLIDIEDQSDAYNIVQMEFLDRQNQYSTAISTANDLANITQYGRRKQDPTSIHVVCSANVAQVAANLWLQRTLYKRKQYRFTVNTAFALMEPGDIVTLTYNRGGMSLNAYAVRIIEIDEQEEGDAIDVICEDLLVGVSHAPLYNTQTGQGSQINRNIDPGGVEANLLLWSEDWTQATWTKTAMTVTAAAANDPVYNLLHAQKLLPTTANSQHAVAQTLNLFEGANYTEAWYFQANGYKYVRFDVTNGGDSATIVFDVSLGELISTATTGTAIVTQAEATPVPGFAGWYRVWITVQVSAPLGGPASMACKVSILDNSQNLTYAGNGTSYILAYGAQITQGVDLRTYAPTTTAADGPTIFNPPVSLTPGTVETWAALAGGPNYGGCFVWLSFDNADYQLIGETTQGSSRFGLTYASFASGSDPDTTHTLQVDFSYSGAEPAAASTAAADQGATLCLINDAAPELVSYSTITNTVADVWSAGTYIRRGQQNTPIGSHAAGVPVIRIDATIFQFPYLALQAGKSAYVKFQPYNLWGGGVTPLENCIAYTTIPVPLAARSPGSSAWTATGTVLSNGGVSTPAIVINGRSDNPSASQIEFFYRVTGTSQWIVGGAGNNSVLQCVISSVANGQTYDVGVAYIVNNIPTAITLCNGSPVTVGNTNTGGGGGGSGVTPGTAIVNTSALGAGPGTALPAGSYTHVDIVLTGYGGAGNGFASSGTGKSAVFTDYGGGGGGVTIVKGFPVTPGTTVINWNLGGVSTNSTVTGTGLSLSVHPGADATSTSGGVGAGGTATTGNTATGSTSVTAYAGRNGGLSDSWDGGGPGATINITSGTVTTPGPDNTTQYNPGGIPGQGGAGSYIRGVQPGGGPNILIIARA